jgi:16S rRNA processing protein RimM
MKRPAVQAAPATGEPGEPGELLAVGTIVKPFGVNGEVVVQNFADSPARFQKLDAVYAGKDAASARLVAVRCMSVERRGVRLSIEGVSDRTAAERMVGNLLFVDPSRRTPLRKGRYYVHDIVGLRVEDEAGKPLGTVQEVLKYPAHDVYRVHGERGEILIPALKMFVRTIDLPHGLMRVRLIEGMVEG